MDLGIIGSIATYLAGVASAGGITWIQHRVAASARREEREADARMQREEREELRRQGEIDRIRGLYKRVAQLGMEYRWLEGSASQAEHWKHFMSRFHEIKAELELDGSADVRTGFEKYLDSVQTSQAEADQTGYVDEYWEHADRAMEQLAVIMRKELQQRVSGFVDSQGLLPPNTDARALPSGDDRAR